MAVTRRVQVSAKVAFVVLGTFAVLGVQQAHEYLDGAAHTAKMEEEGASLFDERQVTVGRTLNSEFSLLALVFGDECQNVAEYVLAIPYLIICIYFFLGLAIICDDYFVSSLEAISEALHLPDDVAGATFMAAGSSAPELFTSVIGVFLTENDVGVGTIVGSAIFNILIIVGITALLAGQTLLLDWRPLTRDSTCYGISILLLLVAFFDEKVYWWESMIFVLFYAFYIGIMFVNKWLMQGMAWVQFKLTGTKPPEPEEEVDEDVEEAVETFVEGQDEQPNVITMGGDADSDGVKTAEARSRAESQPLTAAKLSTVSGSPSGRPSHGKSVAGPGRLSQFMPSPHIEGGRVSFDRTGSSSGRNSFDTRRVGYAALNPRMKWKVAVAAIIAGHRWIDAMNDNPEGTEMKEASAGGVDKVTRQIVGGDGADAIDAMDETLEVEIPEDEKPPPTWLTKVKQVINLCLKAISIPYYIMFMLTVPDCRKEGCWKKTFPITFAMSIVWIGVLSFFMVDFAARAGCALGIPTTIMGLTFIAAGTSVPDALGSVIVAKEGKGDMAIANALGSNVFDICFGLAFPWFIKSAFVDLGGSIDVGADGIVGLLMFVAILFLILFFVYGVLAIRLFHLSPWTGWIFIITYVLFVCWCLIWTYGIKPFV